MYKSLQLFLSLFFLIGYCSAQTIDYSSPDEEENKSTNFEIVGKLNSKFIIFKNSRNKSFFNIYSNEMKVEAKKMTPTLPAEIISTSFVLYNDGFLMFYQYQKKNVLSLKLIRFNNQAEPIGDVIELDTAHEESNTTENKSFKVLVSENKQKIMTFKLNKTGKLTYNFKSILMDKEARILHNSNGVFNTNGKNEFFSEFMVDNDGNFASLWSTGTPQSDNISSVTIMKKNAMEDTVSFCPVTFSGIYLDDVKLKVDNMNHHFLVTSFYSKQKRGNVDGLYFFGCDSRNFQQPFFNKATFSDELRNDAKSDHGIKDAFNDYYLKNIVFNQTGGFLIITESESVSTKTNNMYNRWDNINNSFYMNSYSSTYDPYYNSMYGNRNTVSRFLADNIVFFSFDEKGTILWSNTIRKSQYDDQHEHYVSYGMANTGEELHFVYNLHEKNALYLNQTSVTTSGNLLYNSSPMRNLDKGYDFLPRLGKQVGKKQMILPCLYGNITCFAKIEF